MSKKRSKPGVLLLTVGTGDDNDREQTLYQPLRLSIADGSWLKVILLPSQVSEEWADAVKHALSPLNVRVHPLPNKGDEDDADCCFNHFNSVLETLKREAETGDSHGVGVEVAAIDLGKRALGQNLPVLTWRFGLPSVKESVKGAKQEVPRAAGGIDEAHPGEPKGLHRRIEGLIKNKLLDELRGLKQREALAHVLGQLLVQVPEKTRVLAVEGRRGFAFLARVTKKIEQQVSPVGGRRQHPNRIVLGVKEVDGAGELGKLAEHHEQVVAWREKRSECCELLLAVFSARSGDPPSGQEAPILKRAHEDDGEDPGDGNLGRSSAAPKLEIGSGATRGLLPLPGGLKTGLHAGVLRSRKQISVERFEHRFETFEESCGVNRHRVSPQVAAAPCAFRSQDSGMRRRWLPATVGTGSWLLMLGASPSA